MKKQLVMKDVVKPGVIVALLIISIVVLLFTPKINTTLYFSLLLLSIAILVSKILVVNEYGVSVTYFLYFGIVFARGPITAIIIALLTGAAQAMLATRSTPIDFCIKKDVNTAIRQTGMLIGVALALVFLNWFRGPVWIMNHLVFVYMGILILFWVLIYDVPRMILGILPVGRVSAIIAVSMLINWKLVEIFGVKYISWLVGLA